jgi:hypothetical protein
MAKQTEAQLRAKAKYNKTNTVGYCLRLNKKTDEDIIQVLNSQDSMQGYIKALIRHDILTKEIAKRLINKWDLEEE